MTDCIFCKIVRKEMPAGLVAEEKNAIAFMDISPARKGHVLVVSKSHAEGIVDIAVEDLMATMHLVQRVAIALKESIGPAGFSVVQLNGEASGQTVFHLHFHVIPRHAGDGLAMKWSRETYGAGELEQYREKIAHVLRRPVSRS